jgi:hypothetical protein
VVSRLTFKQLKFRFSLSNRKCLRVLTNAGFLSWLLVQTDRNDNVGNFAVTVKGDEGVPTDNSLKETWLLHLNLRGACKETIVDFEQAWSEFTRLENQQHQYLLCF